MQRIAKKNVINNRKMPRRSRDKVSNDLCIKELVDENQWWYIVPTNIETTTQAGKSRHIQNVARFCKLQNPFKRF